MFYFKAFFSYLLKMVHATIYFFFNKNDFDIGHDELITMYEVWICVNVNEMHSGIWAVFK